MTFDKIFPFFKKGKNIRRIAWDSQCVINEKCHDKISLEDLLADDWIIIGLHFCDAVNALLSGKKIAHAQDIENPCKYYCYQDYRLFQGLGTSEVRDVKFKLLEDQYSNDWAII